MFKKLFGFGKKKKEEIQEESVEEIQVEEDDNSELEEAQNDSDDLKEEIEEQAEDIEVQSADEDEISTEYEKQEEIINENSDDVLVGYHIKPNEDYEFKGLKKDQKKIVDEVLKKFENYTTKNIVEYMHEEKAYKDTKYNEIIDYSYSKFIKI